MGQSYRRQLGTLDVTMLIVGAVIGGGIFMNPPGVARNAGSAELAVMTWVLGGLITMAGAFCFAELGARLPHAGGSYVYLREGYGRGAAFVQGWALLAVSGAGAVAAVSKITAHFLGPLLGLPEGAQTLLQVSAIAVLTVINCVGLRPGAITQNVLTTLKILLLLAVTVAGFSARAALPATAAAPPGFSWTGLASALVPVIFAYNGWQVIGFVAGEIVDAPHRLPRALVTSIVCLILLYVGVNLAYLNGLGYAGLARAQVPANTVMEQALGAWGGKIMNVGVVISTLGFLNVAILTVPRVFQAMAADGLFFSTFGELHPRWNTPAKAIVLQSVWASVLVFQGGYDDLLAYMVFADGLFMGMAAAALFRLRGRETSAETAAVVFHSPGYPWLPALYVLASVAIMVSAVVLSAKNALYGAALIAVGIPIYLVWDRASGGSPGKRS